MTIMYWTVSRQNDRETRMHLNRPAERSSQQPHSAQGGRRAVVECQWCHGSHYSQASGGCPVQQCAWVHVLVRASAEAAAARCVPAGARAERPAQPRRDRLAEQPWRRDVGHPQEVVPRAQHASLRSVPWCELRARRERRTARLRCDLVDGPRHEGKVELRHEWQRTRRRVKIELRSSHHSSQHGRGRLRQFCSWFNALASASESVSNAFEFCSTCT
ncbi:hypothetical protein T492DRAFT_1023552 [Pavlovales sp. CCMP2436]|nr:hypothetical protein T492DRAFT_1023552 [Pavlovales sp. CCMP2436]